MTNKRAGPSLFLMELIFSILVFSLCAGVCLTAFLKADRMSRDARDLNGAVLAAQTLAESFKAEGNAAFEDLGCRKTGEDTYEIAYDANWLPTTETDAAYHAGVVIIRGDAVWTANIDVRYGDGEVYTLTAARAKADEGSGMR
ncbi:MAG: hypothetical protein VB111_07360 [Clostridiaceae bacterium]|nr:hypothetical protein [Clostridiaceae bacterium]